MPSTSKGSLLVVFLTVFIDLLGFGLVLPLLPIYTKDLIAGDASKDHVGLVVGLVMSSFSAMQFLFAPLWGRLSDRIGRRPVIMIGLFGSVIFYAIFGYATATSSLGWIFVSRIGAGIAGATISTAQAYIADTTTLENRNKGMALIGAAFGLGFTFGPVLGFFALLNSGERPSALPGVIAAVLSAVALVLAYFNLPESLDIEKKQETTGQAATAWSNLVAALRVPSIFALLVSVFICVFSLSNFESTLSLFVRHEDSYFALDNRQMCLIFAYVGFVLTVVQGGVVRRVAGKISEVQLIAFGSVVEVLGFALMNVAATQKSTLLLLVALAAVVTGFAFVQPSLNSLVSRRSDPARQGGILGISQGCSSLARILGPLVGSFLFFQDLPHSSSWPLWLAMVLISLGLAVVLVAVRRGHDYQEVKAD